MGPNLLLVAKKAVTPWTWCNSLKSKRDETRKLYFSQQPAPGIYAITSKQKRYLIALRPNGKDVENIFRDLTSKEDVRLKSMVTGVEMKARSGSNENRENTSELASEEKFISSNNEDSLCRHNSAQSVISAASSIISTSHRIAPTSVKNDNQLQTPSQPGQESRKTSSSSLSSQGKISITSTNRPIRTVEEIMKNDGALRHQNSTFGRKSINKSSHSLSSFRFSKHNYTVQGIRKVDLNGYKFLRRPLQIEFNKINKRWMFSSEVHSRTITTPMCRDLNCMAKDMSLCGKTVDMELFTLDDGVSWVVVGRNGGRPWRGQKENLGDDGKLYCVDEKTGCIRRQTVEEVKASRLRLAKAKGKFLVCEDDAAYIPVVRCLKGKH